jgi:hypothetical protein
MAVPTLLIPMICPFNWQCFTQLDRESKQVFQILLLFIYCVVFRFYLFFLGKPLILEPVMALDVAAPAEFQGSIISGLNKRSGLIMSSDMSDDASQVTIKAEVPLAGMFGYSTEIRSCTQGKGEFSMEYRNHLAVSKDVQENLIKVYAAKILAEESA